MSSISSKTSDLFLVKVVDCLENAGEEYVAQENRYTAVWSACLCLTIITIIFRYTFVNMLVKDLISPPCGLRKKQIIKISAFSLFLMGFITAQLVFCLLTILKPKCPDGCSHQACEAIEHQPFGPIIFLLVGLSWEREGRDLINLANRLPDDGDLGTFDGVAKIETNKPLISINDNTSEDGTEVSDSNSIDSPRRRGRMISLV